MSPLGRGSLAWKIRLQRASPVSNHDISVLADKICEDGPSDA